ncbi:sensor domain-containing diguanylate cyclase [Pseudomonas fragariae (ex Marin et al. 2024)]|uniref:sensor domain-containing diguanylate cyclase n=1 Tax=Pseudomonas fragariae (ex Marin et al. 2024) TaxID=3080056 RepID=UPI002A23F506|nr:diguanylate cyclase [Pseudomonas sp. 20]MDX9625891.1 diguanylate cyclase [Pseudomonas sp. 20]
MLIAPYPVNEEARLEFLRSLDVLDTASEETFDRFTRVLAELLQVPTALISLVEADKQWFKSKVGLDTCETSRDIAFCAHALHAEGSLVVEDAAIDVRFHDNPLVVGAPFIRFYAGIPLRSSEGYVVGTLCAIDHRPRVITQSTLTAMKDLARAVERELFHRSMSGQARTIYEDERRARSLSETRFATVFQETPTGKAIVDLDGRFSVVNPKFCEITGYSSDELLSKTFQEITHADDIQQDLALVADLITGCRKNCSLEKRYVRKDGSLVWVDLSVAILREAAGAPLHLIAVILDITTRKHSEELILNHQHELEQRVVERTVDLVRSQETLRSIADNVPMLIAQVDSELRYVFNNARYKEIFNVDPLSLRGKSVQTVLTPAVYEELLPYFDRALAGDRSTRDDIRYDDLDGRIWRATYIPDVRDGAIVGFFVMSLDVTEQKRKEKSLTDRALLDHLTGLPNRAALMEKLSEAVDSAERGLADFSVFFLDLDGFKRVNDEYGHDLGDELLCQVSERLRQKVRQRDTVCRLAGDEFVVIASGAKAQDTCERIAAAMCATLAQPFHLRGHTVKIGTSVGVTVCPAYALTTPEQLLASADAAMYVAKRAGRNCYRFAPAVWSRRGHA